MVDFLLDNFWLSLYVGLSQAFVLNTAVKNKHKIGWIAAIFVLIFAPFWPLVLIFVLVAKR